MYCQILEITLEKILEINNAASFIFKLNFSKKNDLRPVVKLSDGPIGPLLIMGNVLTRSALRKNFLPLRKTTVTVCFPTNVFIFPNYYMYKVNQKSKYIIINYERFTFYVYWMLPSFNLSSLCLMTPYITSLSLKLFLLKPTITIQLPLHLDCMASCCFRQHCLLPSDDHVNAMLVNISKLYYLLSCCIVLCFEPTLKKLE